MAKYDPLKNFLEQAPIDTKEITLSFIQIEQIIGSTLPESAHIHREWWGNNAATSAPKAWLSSRWKVDSVNQRDKWVRFRRQL